MAHSATIDEDALDQALKIEDKDERVQRVKTLLTTNGVRIRNKNQPIDPRQMEEYEQEYDEDTASAYYEPDGYADALGEDWQELVDMEATNDGGNIPNMAVIRFETTLRPSQIVNPTANYKYSQAIRKRGQRMDAYARIDKPCKMLGMFQRYCEATGDKTATKRRATVSKFLAFALTKEAAQYDERVWADDQPIEVEKLISQEYVTEYVDQASERELQGETIRAILDSLKRFVAFVGFAFPQHQRLTKRTEATLKALVQRRTGNRSTITQETQQRKDKSFEHVRGKTLADVWEIFKMNEAVRLLEEAKERIQNGQPIGHGDYNFLLYVCAAILSLFYGLRPEVVKNLRLEEWKERKTMENGVVTLEVSTHKTKSIRPFQSVILTKEHADLFDFYLRYARRQLVSEQDEPATPSEQDEFEAPNPSPDPFFIRYKHKCEIMHPEDLIDAYQKAVSAPFIFTNRDVRHIIETQAKDGWVDVMTSLAISELLGHTPETAIRFYTHQQQPQQTGSMIDALLGLKRLAGEGDDTEGARVPEDQELELNEEPADEDDQMDWVAPDRAMDEIEAENAEEEAIDQPDEPIAQASGYKTRRKSKETPASQISLSPDPERGTYTVQQKLILIATQKWPGLAMQPDLPGRNRGLFATKDIEPGRVICDYHGDRVSREKHKAEMKRLATDDPEMFKRIGSYVLEEPGKKSEPSKERFVIESHDDNRQPESFGRYINHSKAHPNCVPLRKELKKLDGSTDALFSPTTEKGIKAGEELLFDYGKHYKNEPWYTQCPCTNPDARPNTKRS